MATLSRTVIVDADMDREASAILARIGMNVDEAFNLLLTQVVHDECLPFSMHIPNADTAAAITELELGGGKTYTSLDDLFRDMRE
jgi:DNA-damage-inducible protein J